MINDDMPSIECGCGFVATGPDPESNLSAFEIHVCTRRVPLWHESVFSFSGAVILAIVATAVVMIVTGLPLF